MEGAVQEEGGAPAGGYAEPPVWVRVRPLNSLTRGPRPDSVSLHIICTRPCIYPSHFTLLCYH